MSYKNRYTVRSLPKKQDDGELVLNSWKVIKFDRDHEYEGEYTVSKIYSPTNPRGYILTCGCFASNKDTCRHRQIVAIFDNKRAIDTGKTYDFDKQKWYPALTTDITDSDFNEGD